MILYDVGVTRNLCGHVLIEACSADEAEKIAYDRYIKQGRELPDMDECDELSFCAEEAGVNVAKLSVLEFANMLSHGREGEWGPRGLFYVEDGDKIVAVDNRDGYAFTEEFDTFEDAVHAMDERDTIGYLKICSKTNSISSSLRIKAA